MFLVGEVAPAIPALGEALLAILFYAVALGVIALIAYIVAGIVQILDRTVGKIPGIGGVISGAANDIGSIISSVLGSAADAVDDGMMFWWHGLTYEITWIGHEIEQTAGVVAAIASLLAGAPNARAQGWIHAAIRLLLKPVEWLAREAEAGVKKLEKEIAGGGQGSIAKAIHAALRPIVGELHTLERWTYPKVQGIESEIGNVIEPDIQALRDRATAIENQAIRVYQDAAGVWHAVNTDALVAAVALAFGGMGLSGLRCNSLLGSLSNRGCGLWQGLEDVLGLLIDALILTDLCQVLPLAEEAFAEVEAPLTALISDAANAVCAQPPSGWGDLSVPRLSLTPTPGLALSLP